METNAYFEGLKASHYRTGIEMLKDRYNKCITSDGDYVEEQSHIFIQENILSLLGQRLFSPCSSIKSELLL